MPETTRRLLGEQRMSTDPPIFRIHGTFQITKPGNLTTIDPGMTIRFMKMNGAPVRRAILGIPAEWTISKRESVDDISTAVAGMITRHLSIPNECLSLIWSSPQEQHVMVTVVLKPLTEADCEALLESSQGHDLCLCCNHPAPDADLYKGREDNCAECCPSHLCDKCRIIMPDGSPRCYLCFGPEDRSFLEENHRRHLIRMQLLSPEIFGSTYD